MKIVPRLVADSISRSYGGTRVLNSARLSASSGQVTGLLGRMGCGKSTLLKICAGILRSESGWVELDGKKFLRPSHASLASKGLFYLGELDNLIRSMTVRAHFDAVRKRFGDHRDDEWFRRLGVEPLLDRPVASLSGGEIKRVEIALAFARKPVCLLADEPLRSVDPILAELVGESFRELARRGCAVVVTGHEVNTLRPFLDSVVLVTSGTTYPLGPPEAAWSHDGFRREYLGSAR